MSVAVIGNKRALRAARKLTHRTDYTDARTDPPEPPSPMVKAAHATTEMLLGSEDL